MIFGQELINDNGISTIALGFFSVLLTALTTIGVALINRTRKIENGVSEAAENAAIAKQNTVNVSNGFTRRMDTKLDRITESQEELSKALREHLEWHLSKET